MATCRALRSIRSVRASGPAASVRVPGAISRALPSTLLGSFLGSTAGGSAVPGKRDLHGVIPHSGSGDDFTTTSAGFTTGGSTCEACNGSGCAECDDSGHIPVTITVTVTIGGENRRATGTERSF